MERKKLRKESIVILGDRRIQDQVSLKYDIVEVKGFHGNFGFFSYAPTPVGYFPNGKSEFGVQDLVGSDSVI